MEAFKTIYKILKFLEASMDISEFPEEQFNGETFKVSDEYFNSILKMLSDDGYIRGITFNKVLGQSAYVAKFTRPEITIKGLEHLQENSMMKKVADIAKGIIEMAG